jgi:hypothetical protein
MSRHEGTGELTGTPQRVPVSVAFKNRFRGM